LSQLASGAASISPERCVAIERATGRQVMRQDLRPDDWADIWPELKPLSIEQVAA
jgi:DNA-binding transcriptional regulator YdaS (Cro superfamily)